MRGVAGQILLRDLFDVRFPFHVSLVKREFLCVLFIDVIRHSDITQKMRGKRAVNIRTHRFDREFHSGQSDIMLGKFRQSGKVDVFDVGVWNFGIVAIVFLQPARIVIARKIEVVEAWNDAIIDDLDDVRLLQVFRHSIDGCSILGHGRMTKAFAIAFDHFWQIKIDLITRPVLDESPSVPISDLAAHRGDAYRRLRATAELGSPFLAMRYLNPPKLEAESAHAHQHQEAEKLNPYTRSNTAPAHSSRPLSG